MLELRRFPKTQVAETAQALAEDGACIVEDLLSAEQCNALMTDFSKYLTEVPWGVDELGYRSDFYGERTKRLHGLFSKSTLMEQVLTNPVVLEVVRKLLIVDKRTRDVRLSNAELMVLAEHQSEQMFHTDGASWHHAQATEKPQEILISANIALTPFTATNGATRVVPGSHLWEAGREPEAGEITQAVMPKGSALLYSGNVIHSGGANTDAEIRVGLYLGYVVSWLRPLENQLLTNDPKDILALDDAAKQLVDIVPGGFTVMA